MTKPPRRPTDPALAREFLDHLDEYFADQPGEADHVRAVLKIRERLRRSQAITIAQAAKLCRRCKKTVERLKREPDFPAPLNPAAGRGRTLIYPWPALRACLARHLGVRLPDRIVG